ncbi:FKBP-type peptidyl-prolyl cis-trans isomerase [Actinoplanes sp. NPDC023714]|uniref:FKBP-type peptidyl-prolyl cis-trans isomerase n=1 Tax=Actinoplanes sp. NPDC023714 TaxID=3154322 RepID=UPI0033DA410E
MTQTLDTKRRGGAIAGVLTAVLVFAVLAAVIFFVNRDGDEPESAAAPASQTSSAPASPLAVEPEVTPGTGTLKELAVKEIIPGTGPAVKAGQTITVNYKLISYSTGDLIDSSWREGGAPFSTSIGTGQLIKGWDQAIPGQKVGSRIQLDVPADLAYGPQQGDLRFVVDILDAK